MSPAPLTAALRLAAGAVLIGFGLSKFTHHAKEAASFDRYGLPDPSVFAYLIGTVEVGCGAFSCSGSRRGSRRCCSPGT